MAKAHQQYILMHKNVPVAELELDSASGYISAIGSIYNDRHVPVGILVKNGRIDRAALNRWWEGRAIPTSREGIRRALEMMKVSTTQQLVDKCMGLSLSDQYWICPKKSKVKWEDVNFFEHSFSDDVGNILFGKDTKAKEISLMSPDNTSDGWLKKKWVIHKGKRYLIKGGSGAIQQEPYNEVLASRIMDRLSIPHVIYMLITQEGYPYSICEDFVTPQMELISAWYIMQTHKKPNNVSLYKHYLNCCERLEIPGVRDFLDRMITIDYIVANEDRHQNNFGAVRNSDTLQWVGPAPIYDSGSSMWFSKPNTLISARAKIPCKPFKINHDEQIKLVTNFDWLDLSALKGIDEEFREILKGSLFIDEKRRDILCFALRKRIEMLEKIVNLRLTKLPEDNIEEDVTRNTAYNGH